VQGPRLAVRSCGSGGAPGRALRRRDVRQLATIATPSAHDPADTRAAMFQPSMSWWAPPAEAIETTARSSSTRRRQDR
jgi:hypothetical protein